MGMTFLLALLPGFLLLTLFTGGGAAEEDDGDHLQEDDQAWMGSTATQAAASLIDNHAGGDDSIWGQDDDDILAAEDDFPEADATDPSGAQHAGVLADEGQADDPMMLTDDDGAGAEEPAEDEQAALATLMSGGAADPLPDDSFDMVYTGQTTDPVVIHDFDAGSEVIELVLDQGVSAGSLAVEPAQDGADTAITMDGVPLVVLQGVPATDVSLSQVSVSSLS